MSFLFDQQTKSDFLKILLFFFTYPLWYTDFGRFSQPKPKVGIQFFNPIINLPMIMNKKSYNNDEI